MSKRLENLLKKQEEIKAQIQKLKAAQTSEQRKHDTRRKMLLGALVMEMMEKGELNGDMIMERLDKFLSRAGDRKLFGLTVNEKEKSQPPTKN